MTENHMVMPGFKDESERSEDAEYEIRRQQQIDDKPCVSLPDAPDYKANPTYLRQLIRKTGLTQAAVAQRLDINVRRLKHYLNEFDGPDAPEEVQRALEQMAARSSA